MVFGFFGLLFFCGLILRIRGFCGWFCGVLFGVCILIVVCVDCCLVVVLEGCVSFCCLAEILSK